MLRRRPSLTRGFRGEVDERLGRRGHRAARCQVRTGRAAATANVESAGFGGIESQLAASGPRLFAAVNDLALIYKSDPGLSFPSATALITALDQATGEMVTARQETEAAKRYDKPLCR